MDIFLKILLKVVEIAGLLAVIWIFLVAGRCDQPGLVVLGRFRYAHRGYHDKPRIPENSLAAFRRAIERGFGAELDVHLLADGTLAVMHDSSLARTAGAQVQIETLTRAQLGAYRLEGTEEPVPLFGEVLALFEQAQLPLIIELKCAHGNHNALTAAVCRALREHTAPYCIESFDPRVLLWLRKNRPDIVRGQLASDFRRDSVPVSRLQGFLARNLLFNVMTRPDFIAYDFRFRRCTSLRLCMGVQKVYWTIRSREQMDAAEKEGALVIFEQFDPEA